jgi:hypothetical protein
VPLLLASFTVGVAHKEDSVSLVRGTEGGSRYAVPLRVIPDLGQPSEYIAHSGSKQPCGVLHDCESGS